jgi:uncharacterized protein
MEIRRHKDIIAFRPTDSEIDGLTRPQTNSNIIAFHARNLEIAEVSPEVFKKMSLIDLTNGSIPAPLDFGFRSESTQALEAWEAQESPEVKTGKLNFGVRSINLNVTQICNLKCHYCAAGGDGTYGDPVTRISIEKTLPQLKYLLEKVPTGRRFHISFVGGEPFLYPEALRAIFHYTQEVGKSLGVEVLYTVTTNGTLFTDDTIAMLKDMKFNITISLDGAPNINDVVRPSKDGRSSTAMTVAGLKKLNSIRSSLASMGISGVFSKENQDLLSAYEFFQSLEPDWMEFNFAYDENSPEFQKKYLQQMDQIAADLWENGGEESLRKLRTFDLYYKLLDNQQQVENHCGSGKSFLMIDARNQMFPCVWSPTDKSELVGKDLNLRPELMENLQKPLIELNNCQTCWARYICGGGCMYVNKVHGKNKHDKNNLFCERTRHLILTAFTYYKRSRELL